METEPGDLAGTPLLQPRTLRGPSGAREAVQRSGPTVFAHGARVPGWHRAGVMGFPLLVIAPGDALCGRAWAEAS